MRVADKASMFRLLQEGAFGNTTPQWFSVEAWQSDRLGARTGGLWGIRSAATSGGDKRTKLNVPVEEVPGLVQQWFPGGGGQISPMVDHSATLRAHVHRDHQGTQLWYVEGLRQVSWREAFAIHSRRCERTAAELILRRHLNENSFDDLHALLDRFDGHIVELTAMDRCYGTVPHRNTVIWEVRDY